jgi:hypothetical protein
MASRYDNFRVLNNDSEYYAPLRKSRGLKNIQHYETPVLRHPGVLERAVTSSETYIWKILHTSIMEILIFGGLLLGITDIQPKQILEMGLLFRYRLA